MLYKYLAIYIAMRTSYARKLPANWTGIAQFFDGLGDTTRQRILLLFEPEEEIGIKAIAALFDCSRTSIVYHLNVLEEAGLLERRRTGRDVLYRLNKKHLTDVLIRVLAYVQKES